jgi:hypothetical protein
MKSSLFDDFIGGTKVRIRTVSASPYIHYYLQKIRGILADDD